MEEGGHSFQIYDSHSVQQPHSLNLEITLSISDLRRDPLDAPVIIHYIPFMKSIVYSRSAQKTLARMPRNWAIRVRNKISAYSDDPAAQANNVSKLRGEDNLIRLRVGDWRVIMHDDTVLLILKVSSRGSAY